MSETKIVLPNVVRHSIHKALEKGKPFDPGKYQFSGRVVLDVETTVKKGGATQYTPSVKIPWQRVMVVCLSRMGFQRDAIIEKIIEAAEAARDMPEDLATEFNNNGTKAEEMFNDRLRSQLPTATRQGSTTWKGEVNVAEVIAR